MVHIEPAALFKLSRYAIQAARGENIYILLILDLGARWGEVSVTPRLRFSPGKRTPGAHCIGGWVDLRAGLDTEARGEILCLLPEIEPRSFSL
jgi:hypothetical protein